jgi:hypothetical protein
MPPSPLFVTNSCRSSQDLLCTPICSQSRFDVSRCPVFNTSFDHEDTQADFPRSISRSIAWDDVACPTVQRAKHGSNRTGTISGTTERDSFKACPGNASLGLQPQ